MNVQLISHKGESRRKDLEHMTAVMNDSNKPKWARRNAARARAVVVRQIHDHKLMELRSRMVKAAANHDLKAEAKYANRIRDYEGREKLVE